MRFSCSPWAASARRNALARSLSEPKEVAPGSTRLGSQFGDCFIQRLLVPADNRDFSAFCNEKAGGGQADAAVSASDESLLTCEFHDSLLDDLMWPDLRAALRKLPVMGR